MPNVDWKVIDADDCMRGRRSGCLYPMMGTSSLRCQSRLESQLKVMPDWLGKTTFCSCRGEIGLDLYWDKDLL